jgi:hypothetical protein
MDAIIEKCSIFAKKTSMCYICTMILSPNLLLKRVFKRKPTLFHLWKARVEAFLVGSAIILFWRGIWNLADHYLFPDHSNLSAFASLFIGVGILILTHKFVNQFIDDAVEEAGELE